MRWFKRALVGFVSGSVTAALWVAARVLLPSWRFWLTGEGGLGATSISDVSIALAWMIGFAAGFWLTRRAPS